IDLEGGDAASAMVQMEEAGVDAMHVVNAGELAGILTYRSASTAFREGSALKDAIVADFPAASPRARLVELYPLAQSGLPIALTDDAGKFAGVVQPQTVFGVLVDGRASS